MIVENKEEKKYSGAYSRVATLIQPSFQKVKLCFFLIVVDCNKICGR